ncbi:outer membrane beta-barrel protein [Abyssalbus ytuae]|uniref:Porin family protein n=1 Tax=Abyssalbus ytuae TaxID=2926907 RepID=A0A9E6ZLQ4_9FLAO|nr:outer membrane beta-barrel protein [Abyssalbus ytuae]UOB16939.1 porin family protein [Abyssalbus ytuae]
MKKELLFAVILLLFKVVSAQETITEEDEKKYIPPGTWVVGGMFSFNSTKVDRESYDIAYKVEGKGYDFSLAPSIGYSFSKNWLAGVSIGYSYYENESKSFSQDTLIRRSDNFRKSYSVNPYFKKSFDIKNNFLVFIRGDFNYTKSKYEDKNSSDDSEYMSSDQRNNFFVGIKPGITFFLSNKFALESTVGRFGYNKTTYKNNLNNDNDYDDKSDGFIASLDFSSIYFGLSYYF